MSDKGGGIPKTVTINGQDLVVADHPELLALVQSGRKDEKDKLYSTIQTLEANINVLKDENKESGKTSQKDKDELKKLQDELAVAKTDLAKLKKDDPEPPVKKPKEGEADKTGGLTADEVEAIVQKALTAQARTYEEKIEKVQGGLTEKNVSDYRKEVLEKNKGVIIDALVPEGLKSVEEVNKAVEKALETSKQYIRKDYTGEDGKKEELTLAEIEARELSKKDATPPAGTPPTYVPAGTPPPPPAGGGDLTGKALIKDLGSMSQADFNKNREAIKQEIRKVSYEENGQ